MTSSTRRERNSPARPTRWKAQAALAIAGSAATYTAGVLARRRGGTGSPFPGERLIKGASLVGGLALSALVSGGAQGPVARRAASIAAQASAAALLQGGSHLLFDAMGAAHRRMAGPGDAAPAAPGRVLARCLGVGTASLTVLAARNRPEPGSPVCEECRRPLGGHAFRTPPWSGYAACVLSLPYPVIKLAWECGSDIGITRPDVIHGIRGAWIPVLPALAGSILSLALVRPWGRVVPARIPGVGGEPVPRWVVLGPAVFGMAVLLQVAPAAVLAGVRYSRDPRSPSVEEIGLRSWVPLGFYTSWLLWGVALGAAALEYHRTHVGCSACAARAAGSNRQSPLAP
ncbi:hypothetical protein GTW37_15480 [Streptomyces sp. SID4931]|nr:hypothetical protein [Streptomyces sp. SID4931]SCF87624.1 hypothetical protein GA0115255_109673 [Streptomyces sp. Ncost-T6T-2b]